MNKTSHSLLNRLRQSPESESWDRLVHLYSPLILHWMRRYEVQMSDAEDLLQDVLLAVSKDISKFDHNGHPGAFRGWLKTILVNRLRKFWRNRDRRPRAQVAAGAHADSDIDERLAQLEDPSSELSQIWNRQHDQYVLRQLLEIAQPQFAPRTWSAFRRVTLEGENLDTVAKDLGISRNAVVIAKCRVLKRLRQESEGLVEASSFFSPGG